MIASPRPHSFKTASVADPGAGATPISPAGVRLKRGAGDACKDPSPLDKNATGLVVGMRFDFRKIQHRRNAGITALEYFHPFIATAGLESRCISLMPVGPFGSCHTGWQYLLAANLPFLPVRRKTAAPVGPPKCIFRRMFHKSCRMVRRHPASCSRADWSTGPWRPYCG